MKSNHNMIAKESSERRRELVAHAVTYSHLSTSRLQQQIQRIHHVVQNSFLGGGAKSGEL